VLLARSELLTQLAGIVLRASLFFPSVQSMRVHSQHVAIINALKGGDADRTLKLVAEHAKANVATALRETKTHSRLKNGSSPATRRAPQPKR
jgi:DNA-binding GntR family transcriptional regulator